MLFWLELPIMIRKQQSIRPRPEPAGVRSLVLLVLACVLFSVDDAHAYLDPGTGSYVFQMVIAVLLSGAFTLKHFWHRLKARIVRRDAHEPNDDAPAA